MRTRPAELKALESLTPALRSQITPLLECPLHVLSQCLSPKDREAKLDGFVSHLSGWSGRRVLLDFDMLPFPSPHPVEIMAHRATLAGIRPVPVISLKTVSEGPYEHSVQAVLERAGSALCLRVSTEELYGDAIGELVESRLKQCSVSPRQVDLIIDRVGVESGSRTYEEFARRIPSIDAWRTLTLLAGSFPENLEAYRPGKTYRIPRIEWRHWQRLQSWSGRRPAFGDYAIQHVYIKPPVPAPNFSASVRYTLEDEFLILRGEGVKNDGGPGYAQWNGWAALLIESREYFGARFSVGDQYIAERAVNGSSTGSATTWLQAAFSHHLTTVALQVAGRLERVRQIAASEVDWTTTVDVNPLETTT